ncbi:MAG: ABC transporter ATP-binding protein/permease [Bacilli bacterium]|nr:ABC transporter ATP-binding protein/permease [Bacilli bacterium]MCH4236005.1 ABC transporter ATP-binding protein/permease [Bacilli bacterium]
MPPRMNNGPKRSYAGAPTKMGPTLKRLIKFFKPVLPKVIVVVLLLIISSILTVTSPILLRNIMNKAQLTTNNPYFMITSEMIIEVKWSTLLFDFGIILILYIVSALLSWITSWIIVRISADYTYYMRKLVKEKLDRLPLSYFDGRSVGDILSNGTNDVDTISRSLQDIVTQVVSGVSLLLASIAAMLIVSWQLTLVALCIIPISLALAGGIAVISQRQFIKYQNKLGVLEGKAEESFTGYTIVKLFNREKAVINDFEGVNREMQKTEYKAQFFSAVIHPLLRFVNNLGYVAVTVAGGLISAVQIGDIIAFLMFLNIFGQPLQNLGSIVNIFQATIAAAERIFALLDAKEMEPDAVDAISDNSKVKGEVVFEHVSFSYSEDKPLIEDMNLHVLPGEAIAIVGPTGAGKTTIVNLIMRFYEINKGKITLDGVDIRNYSRGALRTSVGMVLQDTWLFAGSIKNNIRYGRGDASDEEVVAAAKAAHADHFIRTLPEGYDFVLNEDGTNISQGQRQLITIARAMLARPKILILDEATSSVDTRTEALVQSAMNRIMEGRTSFVIAHRLSTIKNAKTILVMKKGHIIESGSHNELLAAHGFYADLYNAQFLGTNPMEQEEGANEEVES